MRRRRHNLPSMGLDAVEIVMEVEDRFDVKISDEECEGVRTVADLAALVIKRLPRSEGPCPTAREFFAIRKLMVTHSGIERRRVRPKARLTEMFPGPARRPLWISLRVLDDRLPQLKTSSRAASWLVLFAACAACAWFMATAALWGAQGPAVAIPASLLVFVIGAGVLQSVRAHLSQHFPPGLETVGDLVRLVAPFEMPQSSQGARSVGQQRVLLEVRRLTAQVLGLPLERVQPSSDFVKDLHID